MYVLVPFRIYFYWKYTKHLLWNLEKITQNPFFCNFPRLYIVIKCIILKVYFIAETKRVPSSTPSPGECLAILHCVLTCKRGYDVGDVGKDGCPTCHCID